MPAPNEVHSPQSLFQLPLFFTNTSPILSPLHLYIIEVKDVEKRTSWQQTCTCIHPSYSTLKLNCYPSFCTMCCPPQQMPFFNKYPLLLTSYSQSFLSVFKYTHLSCVKEHMKRMTIFEPIIPSIFFLLFPLLGKIILKIYLQLLSPFLQLLRILQYSIVCLNPHHFKEIALIRVTKDLLVIKMDCS